MSRIGDVFVLGEDGAKICSNDPNPNDVYIIESAGRDWVIFRNYDQVNAHSAIFKGPHSLDEMIEQLQRG